MTSLPDRPLHILVLTDREWKHPQGGGTGTNLHAQVMRWLEWGHRVTIIASAFDVDAATGGSEESNPCGMSTQT